jgi:hypothetical protein
MVKSFINILDYVFQVINLVRIKWKIQLISIVFKIHNTTVDYVAKSESDGPK